MKVIKEECVDSNAKTENSAIDQKKVAELKEKFDTMQNMLLTKEYAVLLEAEETKFLFETVYNNIQWKGYESYAISETYDQLNSQMIDGSLNGKVKVEIIEAVFHFLKNYVSSGVNESRLFRKICDQFALPMNEINQDRQNLRDISLEYVSAEQGIPVEQLIENLNRQQGQQKFQG